MLRDKTDKDVQDMKFCSIASGSSGNCIYVGSSSTNILVDAGISAKRIENGLNELEISPDTIQGILITHEHSDHISGLGVFARRYNIPIYATYETIRAIRSTKGSSDIPEQLYHSVCPDETFYINDILIEPYSTSHDASNPVCYTVRAEGQKIGIATDLGKFDDYVLNKLAESDLLYVEANHDVNMLMVGKYPYFLKQRILSDKGHLSNDSSADMISRLIHPKLKNIILAHLSKENNYEELAYETVCCELMNRGSSFPAEKISVAHRDRLSEFVFI